MASSIGRQQHRSDQVWWKKDLIKKQAQFWVLMAGGTRLAWILLRS
jgi:hypothetical protein